MAKKNRIYLDYAATTPIDKEVFNSMAPYLKYLPTVKFGNPGSLHYFGQEALSAVDEARETIAKNIFADFNEIIFTSSATEANNLAIKGALKGIKSPNFKPKIIISSIEHESVFETAKDLENEGFVVVYLTVNSDGFINLKELQKSLDERAILVSIMCANNEIGVIQNIKEISKIIKDFKNNLNRKSYSLYPLFHTDAVQAFQFLDCNVNNLNIDLMTISSHKIYGPKGAAALYARSPNLNPHRKIQNPKLYAIKPIITGGGQEFGLRSGTENVPSIVGFAKAVELAVKNREKEKKRQAELLQYFYKNMKKIYPALKINGPKLEKFKNDERLPNILNIYFPKINAENLLIKLDLSGIAASTGSACKARSAKPSRAIKAMDFDQERQKNNLRFSIGKFTTKNELDSALKIIKSVL